MADTPSTPASPIRPIRVALIGCGQVARRHVARLVQDPRVVCAVLCDPQESAARRLAEEFHLSCAIENDVDRALDRSRVDAAILASPTTLHHRHACRGLAEGIDLLIEKPIASNSSEVHEIEAAARKANRFVGVSYQRRFESLYRTARREIQERRDDYGAVHTIHIFVCERWSQTIGGTWRDDPAISGGYFADGGSHQVDVAFFITGARPVELRASIDRRDRNVAIQTRVEARLTGGIRLVAHFVGDAQHWREDIIFHAEKGDLVLKNGQELERWFGDRMLRTLDGEEGTSPNRAFIDALSRRLPGQQITYDAPLEAGKIMVQWSEAVLRSAHEDRWVRFDERAEGVA